MSTEPKWTPAPWQVEDPMGPDILSVVAHADKPVYDWLHIVQLSCDADDDIPVRQVHANAHLIAAAPDLYERLEASTKTLILERDCYYETMSLPDGTVPDDDDVAQLENLDAEIAANQAALAKARGEA